MGVSLFCPHLNVKFVQESGVVRMWGVVPSEKMWDVIFSNCVVQQPSSVRSIAGLRTTDVCVLSTDTLSTTLISVMTSQAFVQRIFSVCGFLTEDRGHRMTKSLEMRVFLRLNARIISGQWHSYIVCYWQNRRWPTYWLLRCVSFQWFDQFSTLVKT